MDLGMFTVPGAAISGGLVILIRPCFPGNFGYFLLASCTDSESTGPMFPEWILRHLFVGGSVWIIVHITTSFVLEIAVFSSLHCFCLANYQNLLWWNVKIKNNFWETVQMQKEIQLLTANYNWIHGNVLSVAVTIYASSNFIIGAYACLCLHSEMSPPEFLFFGLISFDCFLIMLFCDGGFKSTVNSSSIDALARIRTCNHCTTKTWSGIKRYLKSWPVAKIKLGCTNFYDKETPLNLIQFSVGQVVTLLLL